MRGVERLFEIGHQVAEWATAQRNYDDDTAREAIWREAAGSKSDETQFALSLHNLGSALDKTDWPAETITAAPGIGAEPGLGDRPEAAYDDSLQVSHDDPRDDQRRDQRRLLWKASIALFLVSEIGRLFYVFAILPSTPMGLAAEPSRIAVSLATTGRFANPYKIETGYTAHMAPLQPLLLSGMFRVFGMGRGAERAKEVMNSTFRALRDGMMPALAVSLGLSLPVGILAAAISMWPMSPLEIVSSFEAANSAALLLLATILSLRHGWRAAVSRRWLVAEGLLWGVILLFNPALLPVLAALVLAALWQYGRFSAGPFLKSLMGMLLVTSLIAGPWIIRNYQRFDSFIFIRDNLGLELQISNNDRAEPTFWRNVLVMRHPNLDEDEAAMVKQLGEVEYNRRKRQAAVAWIRANPGKFWKLTRKRFLYFWFPPDFGRFYRYPLWMITAAGFAGLVRLILRGEPGALPISLILLIFPITYYVVQTDGRYRDPVYTFSVLPAAYLVCNLKFRLRRGIQRIRPRQVQKVQLLKIKTRAGRLG
ncbi:MAG TPA: hypothetical protein VGG72_32975 [Bryobacteraceae bacterium]|jgi:hypothetical protein